MQEFIYHRPTTIDDAITAISQPDARPLAGGTDLIAQLRERRRTTSAIVDLKRLPGLTAIEARPDGGLRIGAAMSCTAVARHPRVLDAFPALAEAARLVGSLQIQNRASLGGNACNASPSADTVPILMALDAKAEIHGPKGPRTIAIAGLATGPGRTSLATGELLTALVLPAPVRESAAAYQRFTPRREMDIAIAGVGARIVLDPDRRIALARIALAAVGPTVLRASSAEAFLAGKPITPGALVEAGRTAAAEATPISDTRGSADYRRMLIEVLTARVLAQCAGQLGIEVMVP